MIQPSIIEPLSYVWYIGIFVSIIFSLIIIQVAIRIPPDKRRILMIFLGLLYYLKNNFYDFSFKNIAESLAISGLISFIVCIFISYVSTSIITGKFINSKIDNLY